MEGNIILLPEEERHLQPHEPHHWKHLSCSCSSIAELRRGENINANLYYNWSKDFLEAGKGRLAGDIKREATTTEVHELKNENMELKQLVAELSLELRKNKKNTLGSD
jgi:transposase